MAVIEVDSAGGPAAQPFRDEVGRVLARLHGRRTGLAVLECIGAFDPGYPTTIVVRRAAASSSPVPDADLSLDQLLQGGGGGSGIGHTTTRRTMRQADTSSEEERAWRRLRGQPVAPSGPLIGPTTSRSVPVDYNPAARSPDAEMLHELVHGLRTLDGSRLAAARNSGPSGYSNHEEFYATTFENVFRSEAGLELRKGYGGVDRVFLLVERHMTGSSGSLNGEFSPFPRRPTAEDLEWAGDRFATAHAQPLRTLRTQSSCLFTRFAQIPATVAPFNPIRVFAGR